jgi:hypothetical protein
MCDGTKVGILGSRGLGNGVEGFSCGVRHKMQMKESRCNGLYHCCGSYVEGVDKIIRCSVILQIVSSSVHSLTFIE